MILGCLFPQAPAVLLIACRHQPRWKKLRCRHTKLRRGGLSHFFGLNPRFSYIGKDGYLRAIHRRRPCSRRAEGVRGHAIKDRLHHRLRWTLARLLTILHFIFINDPGRLHQMSGPPIAGAVRGMPRAVDSNLGRLRYLRRPEGFLRERASRGARAAQAALAASNAQNPASPHASVEPREAVQELSNMPEDEGSEVKILQPGMRNNPNRNWMLIESRLFRV